MTDTSHLVALHNGLAHEKDRLSKAKTDSERAIRTVWVKQLEREVADEYTFLGMAQDSELETLSDDDLLAALSD